MRIQQLPIEVANQIAAGEIIERPASIVKELLENALDAQATIINIDIGFGGLNQIKISDNGMGIIAEDLPLAITSHATSKLSKIEDLAALETLGFRGEALASIASVAKLTISSKPAMQEHGLLLAYQNQQVKLSPFPDQKELLLMFVIYFIMHQCAKNSLKLSKRNFRPLIR